jgi:hypothetical protein
MCIRNKTKQNKKCGSQRTSTWEVRAEEEPENQNSTVCIRGEQQRAGSFVGGKK